MKIWIQHFCSRLSIIYLVLSILMIVAIALPAMAIMPPENYAQKAKQSKIKAIATIETVKTLDVGTYYSTKKVTFRLEYALTKNTPKIFNGYCKSMETVVQKKNTTEGGEIYFYPLSGQRVYVTVYHYDGNITTMTPVTVELEKGIRQTPDKIRYVMGRAHIQDNPKDLTENKPFVLLQTKWAGKDPVHSAGNSELDKLDKELKALETLGMDVHGTPEEEMQGQLLVALGNDDERHVYQLLKNGARINKPFNSSGQTPLMAAESLAMVKLLCQNGADTRLKDVKG